MAEELVGFNFLKDMTKAQLIDEIVSHQREVMQKSSMENLRANVIDLRVLTYKQRLCDEAGLVAESIFGYGIKEEDDDND